LKSHLRKDHGVDDVKQGRFVCKFPECHTAFYHARKLADHYSTEHDLSVGMDIDTTKRIYHCMHIVSNHKELPDWTAFEKWKEEEETSTFTSFVQPKGKTTSCENGITVYTL